MCKQCTHTAYHSHRNSQRILRNRFKTRHVIVSEVPIENVNVFTNMVRVFTRSHRYDSLLYVPTKCNLSNAFVM